MALQLSETVVDVVDASPPPTLLLDTGTGFFAGLADRGKASGPIAATEVITSLGDFVTKHGARQSYNGLEYDAVSAFFADGGSRAYFSRIVGPAAARAASNVPTVSPKFVARAKGPGSYGNALKVSVASGVVTIKDGTTIVEVSPQFADLTEAQDWATYISQVIDIEPVTTGALSDSADVTLGTLTAGADDRASITDVQRAAALARMVKDLGPGQVAMPGDTRTAAHALLATHALATNRFAYGDGKDTATAATLAADGTAARALGRDLARHIQICGPWLRAPGDNGVVRAIPPCGVMMGLAARADATGNPNTSTARFASRVATDVKITYTAAERLTLAQAGVTVMGLTRGGVRPTDDLTPVDIVADPEWLQASTARMVMRIVADAQAIGDEFLLAGVTGPKDYAAFNGALSGMLSTWFINRSLYSSDGTPSGAFRVETGSAVNTPATIANRELRAALSLKVAPNARRVVVTVTNTPINANL